MRFVFVLRGNNNGSTENRNMDGSYSNHHMVEIALMSLTKSFVCRPFPL